MSQCAPAKINLYLHVTGRREDGYHTLESLMVFSAAGDVLLAEESGDLSLSVSGPFGVRLGAGEDNLVLRAARGLRELSGTHQGAALYLTKNLPLASGIGGGSADAAAALRALCALWRLTLAPEKLHSLALSLGADVPVCLEGKNAFVGGIGESLDIAPALPPCFLVLVNPRKPLSTPGVFAAFAGSRPSYSATPARFNKSPADARALAALLRETRNDLTAAARAQMPEVGDVLACLEESAGCLLSRMSGSGATCFGLYATEREADAAAEQIAAAHPGWWVQATALAGSPGR